MNIEKNGREILSVGLRLVLLGVMAVVLLLVSLLIYPLVGERMDSAEKAVESIAAPWGKQQVIGGPMLVVPYAVRGEKEQLVRKEMVFMADSLSISATVVPEERARGIYKALLYRSEATVEGSFKGVLRSSFPSEAKEVYWDEAALRYGVSDIVGLKNFVRCEVGEDTLILDKVTDKTPNRFSFSAALTSPISTGLVERGFPFRLEVELNGNETIGFCPMGRTTDVEMKLRWSSPSFVGRFLPDRREVTDSLTTARWRVLSINHQIPASFSYSGESDDDVYRNSFDDVAENEFAVKLLQPVSHYKQVDRSVKYAILLIVFTFLTIFFCDYFAKKMIPLFSYLLVGVALLLFYTLLLSLSELVGFEWAYIISGVAVVGLSTVYMYGFLRSAMYTAIGGGVMVLLYGMMYILLTLENLPLLIGSIFLFVVLAVVMRLSLKMRW